ncbi:MAG TPA: hypothetical protein VIP11_23395 [Gemmatimonadaceae bacterium]
MSETPQRKRRNSGPTVVITAEDGTVLHCTPVETGETLSTRESRWMVVEPSGDELAGPPFTGFTTRADLQELMSSWWKSQKAPPSDE